VDRSRMRTVARESCLLASRKGIDGYVPLSLALAPHRTLVDPFSELNGRVVSIGCG
jgi:hypothetical protein